MYQTIMIPSRFHPNPIKLPIPNFTATRSEDHKPLRSQESTNSHFQHQKAQIFYNNMFGSQVSCTYILCISIIAVLFTNKFMQDPHIYGPKFKSVRFYEVLFVNGSIAFIVFFALRFKLDITKSINYIQYTLFIFIIQLFLLLYFNHYRKTHSAFDEFIETIMYTYNSKELKPTTTHNDVYNETPHPL